MAIIIKKPSELDTVHTIDAVHTVNNNEVGLFCPNCGVESIWDIDELPIDIRIVCGVPCGCIFIIPNTVAIED